MNRKTLILSIPVILAVFLLGGWFLLSEPQSAPESQNIPVVEENPTQNMGETNSPLSETDTPESVDTQFSPETDTSNWKMYRNEKLGFEFKLSDEYSIPENEKNIVGKKENVTLLDPKKTEYLFNSRKGLELSREVRTTGDVSRIRVRVYPYTAVFETDFGEWLNQNSTTSILKIGRSFLRNSSDVTVVSWNSICDDYSAFFMRKDYILEFNTCGSTFFSDISGGEEDYFSSILNSVRF